jgi:alpha-beta hydrolase superfamily lysophospholipase
MRSQRLRGVAMALAGALIVIGFGVWQNLPSWAAYGLLHPFQWTASKIPQIDYQEVTFTGWDAVQLKGWRFPARGVRRGTLIYLHGIADNRGSSLGAAERFTTRGFAVIAFDSRAHGESGGTACTYGYYEKRDLQKVLDTVDARPIVVMGASLGAAVALQTAAEDPRIDAIVSVEPFSDLKTVATERAPFFLTSGMIQAAFATAERQGHFSLAAVSPELAAARITVPVMLIHGALDDQTPPAHSQRIYAALKSPKRLLIADGAGHNQSLTPAVWLEIEEWIDGVTKGAEDAERPHRGGTKYTEIK